MKNKVLLIGCIFVLLLSSTVFAAKGLYISGNIGASIPNDSEIEGSEAGVTLQSDLEFDTGFTGGIATGNDLGKVRLEVAVGYSSNELEEWKDITITGLGNLGDASGSGDITALSVLVNGYYDMEIDLPFTPYIGGGIGFAKIEIDDITIAGVTIMDEAEDDTVFAYQLGLGIGIDVSEKVTLDLGYRFFATADPEFDGVEVEVETHNFIGGVRLSF